MTKGEYLEIPKISDLTERHCQILGAIGQVGVMSRLSGLYRHYQSDHPRRSDQRPAFAVGKFLYAFRPDSLQRVEGLVTRASHDPNDTDNIVATSRDLCLLDANVRIHYMTRLALRYRSGDLPYDIATETEEALDELTNHYVEHTSGLIETHRSLGSPIFEERKVFGPIRGEIAYYIKSD